MTELIFAITCFAGAIGMSLIYGLGLREGRAESKFVIEILKTRVSQLENEVRHQSLFVVIDDEDWWKRGQEPPEYGQ